METDSFVISVDTDNKGLVEFRKQNKKEFDFSELHSKRELYDPSNRVIGRMTIETSPVLVLDSFIALRAKSYTVLCSDHTIQKANLKVIQHTPHYVRCLFNSETTHSTNYSIRSKLTRLRCYGWFLLSEVK